MASTLGLVLLLSAFGILYDSIGFAEVMRTRAAMNAAARESLNLLLDGGLSGSDPQYGLRGLATAPTASTLRTGNRVKLKTNADATVAELLGARIAATNITCAGDGDPITACTAAGTLSVDGYLGGDPTLYETTRSIPDGAGDKRTQELEIILFSAYNLNRDDATTAQSIEVYRTIYTLNLD